MFRGAACSYQMVIFLYVFDGVGLISIQQVLVLQHHVPESVFFLQCHHQIIATTYHSGSCKHRGQTHMDFLTGIGYRHLRGFSPPAKRGSFFGQ